MKYNQSIDYKNMLESVLDDFNNGPHFGATAGTRIYSVEKVRDGLWLVRKTKGTDIKESSIKVGGLPENQMYARIIENLIKIGINGSTWREETE